MGDAAAVLLAVAAAAGALLARPVPIAAAVVLALIAVLLRSATAAVAATAVAASALAAEAWAGVRPPLLGRVPPGTTATLVADPAPVHSGAVRAVARVRGKHVELWARGAPAAALRPRLAGERIEVQGSISRLPPSVRARLAPRHIGARMTVTGVAMIGRGPPHARAANAVRTLLVGGADSLPPARRALFAGIVLGDDRGQDPATIEDFRASGLSHLLAVSGQNVAFALALAGPALRRLALRGRLLGSLAVLGLFGTMTRWEPSVLRAVVMTGLGVFATTAGRQATAIRLLSLAVALALLVDPLLVRSLGFLLSVGASAGIVVLAPPLRRRLPEPLAVTVAAQIGVAPILLPAFGSMPLVAPLANVAATPATGPLMTWGVLAGLPAGVLDAVGGGTGPGAAVAAWLHAPTALLVGWIALVARGASTLPFGHLTARDAAAGILVAVAAAAIADLGSSAWARAAAPSSGPSRHAAVRVARTAAVVALAALLGWRAVLPTLTPAAAVAAPLDTGSGGDRLWRRAATAVVVTDGRAPPGRLLRALRRRGVTSVTVLVVTSGGRAAGRALEPVLERLRVELALVPADRDYGTHPVPAVHARAGMRVHAGPWDVAVVAAGPPVEVQVRSVDAPRARSP